MRHLPLHPGRGQAIGVVLMLVTANLAVAQSYTVTDIGVLPGGTYARAEGINNLGQVVGTSDTATAGRAFLWLPQPDYGLPAGMNDLGTLGGDGSGASAVSDAGHVTGSSLVSPGNPRAFLWTSSTGMINLAGPPFTGQSSGHGVNALGEVAGSGWYQPATAERAFLHQNGSNFELGILGQTGWSMANAINDNGDIVGSSVTTGNATHAFFIEAYGGMVDISSLADWATANDINDAQQVVGAVGPNVLEAHATLWERSGPDWVTTGLGTLGGVLSNAHAINNHGQIVGSSRIANGDVHAFLYDNGTMYDLNNLIPAGSGLVLRVASDINDAGQIAVTAHLANGSPGFDDRAVLLTPQCVGSIDVTNASNLVTTEGGGTAQFDVALSGPTPAGDVTINVTSSHPNEGLPSPSQLTFTPANHTQPQTVTITGQDDFVIDGDVQYEIFLTSASTDACYDGLAAPPVPVTNLDDDAQTCPVLVQQLPTGALGILSDADCDACQGSSASSVADHFVLASTQTIETIVIWGGYFPDNHTPPDDFTVIFHVDNGSVPGAVIASECGVNSTRVQTGVVLWGTIDEWQYTLDLRHPVTLPPGPYFLEIFNDTSGDTDTFFWEQGALDPIGGQPGGFFDLATPGGSWTYDPQLDVAMELVCGSPNTCTADIVPTPYGDGVVDVQDLLAVFADWGECCVAADINNDGCVDTDDLLQIFSQWGQCP